jgi:hypothetical protein
MRLSALDKINLFATVYGRMFAAILRFGTWSGFFFLALIQFLGLLALARFYMPGLYQIVFPILSAFVPNIMFHYPQYYVALPSVYSGFDSFILGPTFWIILSAFAVYKLGGYYSGERCPAGEGFKTAFRAYLPLLIFWAVETGLVLAAVLIPSQIAADLVAGSPRRKMAMNAGLQFFAFGISAFLIYTIPGIILDGKGVRSAMADSIRFCRKNFFLTYFIVLVPGSLRVVSETFLAHFSPRIVKMLNPELIIYILISQIVLGIFINLFIYGTAVFIYREIS